MKKWFTLLLVMSMIMIMTLTMTLVAPVSAAVTGEWTDKTLEIAGLPADKAAEQTKMEKGKNNIVDFSEFGSTDPGTKGHRVTYEYNQDLLDTVLLKQDNDRNPNLTEYITYKMDKNIAGFEFDVLCCAGLGDPLTDLSIFVSKTGAAGSWAQIKTQATYYEFDPNYYLVWDKAYWFHSTLTNAQAIPSGYKYIKIQFNPCNDQGDVSWNVAIDDVKIIFGTNVSPVTIPANKKFVDWETINAQREATRTTGGTTTTTTTGGNNKPTGGNSKPTGDNTNATGSATGAGSTTTATNDKGEIITDPTTTATNEQGEVITDPTGGNNDSAATPNEGADANANANGENKDGQDDGGNGLGVLPWVALGAVAIAGAAVAIFLLVFKKKD